MFSLLKIRGLCFILLTLFVANLSFAKSTPVFSSSVTNLTPTIQISLSHLSWSLYFPGRARHLHNIPSHFHDLDDLAYTATSSNTGVATATITINNSLQVTPLTLGTATITITATDSAGQTVSQIIPIEVYPNVAPEARGTIGTQFLQLGSATPIYTSWAYLCVDSNPPCRDPLSSDIRAEDKFFDTAPLVFTATSNNRAVATISTTDGELIVNAIQIGAATITITATDIAGLTAMQSFAVNISGNQPPTTRTALVIPPQTAHDLPSRISLASYFADSDRLLYTATTSDASVAAAAIIVTGASPNTAIVPDLQYIHTQERVAFVVITPFPLVVPLSP